MRGPGAWPGGFALSACRAGGCRYVGERIAQPHSSSLLEAETVAGMESTIGVESATFRTPDGVLLAYGSIGPVAGDVGYTISRGESRMKYKFKLAETHKPDAPEGSAVVLNGWGWDADSMPQWRAREGVVSGREGSARESPVMRRV